jgi:acetyl esterase
VNPSLALATAVKRTVLRRLASLPAPLLRALVGPPKVGPEGAPLHIESQLLLKVIEVGHIPETHELGVARGRREFDQALPILDYAGVRVRAEDRAVPGLRGPIPIRIYQPMRRRARRPVLVFFHGGGFVVGSVASHDGTCRTLAKKADAIVVSVDYRLAPEHPFPAGVEDAVAATRWVLANAGSFGGDPKAVAVGGDSAGGNLAAVVTQEMRSDAARPIFQLLVYPATDMTRSLPSHALFRGGYTLSKELIDWFVGQYLTTDAQQKDPRASPLFAVDLRGLPPALVITAGFDPLRDEGRAYAEKLEAAGVEVDYVCVRGAMHGFFVFGGVFTHAQEAVDEAALALRRAFAMAN